MAFYCPDGAMAQRLQSVVAQLQAEGRPELEQELSITWLRYDRSLLQSAAASDSAAFWGDRPAPLCSREEP